VVAKIFKHYDFVAVPVVDKENRLVGIVTVDDAIDVMEEEHTEDITKMAAIMPLEEENDYFSMSVVSHAKQRIIWLVVLMLSATVSGAIITSYEAAFAAVPLLVSFIPMLMGTGGNSGSQSSTLIIRGIALDEIRFRDLPRVIFKEFRISILVGIILSILNGLRIVLVYKDVTLAIVVAVSLLFTIIIAKLIGGALPMLAKKLGLDPAIMAAPLITTIVDTCSILIFFQVATLFFKISV
jgi:magnesium transporter